MDLTLSVPRDEETVTSDFLQFQHPFKAIFYGSSKSGKTSAAIRFIRNRDELITPKIDKVYVCYGSHNKHQYEELLTDPDVELYGDNPDNLLETIYKSPGNKLMFLDDFCEWLTDSKESQIMFMKMARHSNLSVIITTQALNNGRGGSIGNLIKNADLLFLFQSAMMESDLRRLSRQIFSKADPEYLIAALDLAISSQPYTSLCVRLHQTFPYDFFFRVSSGVLEAKTLTDIFIYIPRKRSKAHSVSSLVFDNTHPMVTRYKIITEERWNKIIVLYT